MRKIWWNKLLDKDPNKRLGSKNDAIEIKNHPWFDSVNWEDVQNKKIKPYHPYLSKSKEELLYDINSSNILIICFIINEFKFVGCKALTEKWKEYFDKIKENETKITLNKVSGWTFTESFNTNSSQ